MPNVLACDVAGYKNHAIRGRVCNLFDCPLLESYCDTDTVSMLTMIFFCFSQHTPFCDLNRCSLCCVRKLLDFFFSYANSISFLTFENLHKLSLKALEKHLLRKF